MQTRERDAIYAAVALLSSDRNTSPPRVTTRLVRTEDQSHSRHEVDNVVEPLRNGSDGNGCLRGKARERAEKNKGREEEKKVEKGVEIEDSRRRSTEGSARTDATRNPIRISDRIEDAAPRLRMATAGQMYDARTRRSVLGQRRAFMTAARRIASQPPYIASVKAEMSSRMEGKYAGASSGTPQKRIRSEVGRRAQR
ncbi:hypothetical protein B0H19DRAFT_1057218 [Mycena capillaripes]|nr:hypothetical protein B0H19DRAFT_1057218 [Mycena capillaripes]